MTEHTDELTVTQTMIRLGRGNRTIHDMIADGRLKARLVPAPVPYYLITILSIESFEASQQEKERDHSSK